MAKRCVLDGISREHRIARRQELGSLRSLLVRPATLNRYKIAVSRFFDFLVLTRQGLPQTPRETDDLLSEFLEELWVEGESKSLAADTLSGVQFFEPSLKKCIPMSWRLFKAWQQHEVPNWAVPITQQFLNLLCGRGQKEYPKYVLGCLVAYYGLLRTGELFKLQRKHVTVVRMRVHLFLGETKMSARNASTDSTTFEHRLVAFLLQCWVSVSPPEEYLVPGPPQAFRAWLKQALSATKLTPYNIKPYSLRRGGATKLFQDCQSYSLVCQSGRWSSEKTARVYIQDSLALLQDMTFVPSARQRSFLQRWATFCEELEPSLLMHYREKGRKRVRGTA